MASLPQLLDEIAECEDSILSYTVTHNSVVTHVAAHTREKYPSAVEAVQAALQLVKAVTEAGYSLINRAEVGAITEIESYASGENGLAVDAGIWRGKVSVVLSPHT